MPPCAIYKTYKAQFYASALVAKVRSQWMNQRHMSCRCHTGHSSSCQGVRSGRWSSRSCSSTIRVESRVAPLWQEVEWGNTILEEKLKSYWFIYLNFFGHRKLFLFSVMSFTSISFIEITLLGTPGLDWAFLDNQGNLGHLGMCEEFGLFRPLWALWVFLSTFWAQIWRKMIGMIDYGWPGSTAVQFKLQPVWLR